MEKIVAAGVAIIMIGNAVRMLWNEFGATFGMYPPKILQKGQTKNDSN